jgi:transposase
VPVLQFKNGMPRCCVLSGYRLTVLQRKLDGKLNVGRLFKPLRIHASFQGKIVLEVLYQGKDIQKAVDEYELPSTYTLQMWIRGFQKQLGSSMIVLPSMTEEQKANLKASEHRIKYLEKALDYANVVIFSLNHLIEFAEKHFSIAIRKKAATKQ